LSFFGKAGLGERGADAEGLGSTDAGAVVILVVEVVAADYVVEISVFGELSEDCKQMRFAVEAAVGLVGGVVRVGKFIRLDGLDFDAKNFCESDSLP